MRTINITASLRGDKLTKLINTDIFQLLHYTTWPNTYTIRYSFQMLTLLNELMFLFGEYETGVRDKVPVKEMEVMASPLP